MTERVDVYWSFRSPYSYLVTPDLLRLREDYDVAVNLCVVLPLALRNKEAVFNPADAKRAMYIVMDSARRAELLGMPYAWPNPDPVVQNVKDFTVAEEQPHIYRLSTLGVEAQRRGKGVDFAAAVSRLVFGGTRHWDQGDKLEKATAAIGLDLGVLEAATTGGDHLDEINRNHDELEAAGHWGVPTMVVRGEPFFGQDRVDTLRWRLDHYGLRSN